MARKSKQYELINETFGRLYVMDVERDERDGKLKCLCRCSCGNQKLVDGYSLRKGYTKSCGCLAEEKINELNEKNIVDLTNKVFGNLTVVGLTGKSIKRRGVLWKCRCSCGNEIDALSRGLVKGYIKSCGCLCIQNKEDIKHKLGMEDGTIYSKLNNNIQKNNTSGVRGVYWENKRSKYMATITYKGKYYFLGRFNSLCDAKKARKLAEESLWGKDYKKTERFLKSLGKV